MRPEPFVEALPQDRVFTTWDLGGYGCYAFSGDALRWEKPELDVIKSTNIAQCDERDSAAVWFV